LSRAQVVKWAIGQAHGFWWIGGCRLQVNRLIALTAGWMDCSYFLMGFGVLETS